MHKDLQFHVWHLAMNGLDLFDRQLASQHHTGEAQITQPTGFLGRASITLGGGM